VLSREEIGDILCHLEGEQRLMAALLYGSGLRLLECAQLRVQDIDLESRELTVCGGKGQKDRITMLPSGLLPALQDQLQRARRVYSDDVRGGVDVKLPDALALKYPNAPREWAWRWVFPARRTYRDRETGRRYRHHLHEAVLQRSFHAAVRLAGIAKPASCHTPAPFLRYASTRGGLRPSNYSGASRPLRREHDDDLYPCPQSRRSSGHYNSPLDSSTLLRYSNTGAISFAEPSSHRQTPSHIQIKLTD
jgi:hypothetical protein